MPLRVAFIAEGDAETRDCWSGLAQQFVRALRAEGLAVDVFNAEPRGVTRAAAAAFSFAVDKARWRQRYLLGGPSFAVKSTAVSKQLRGSGVTYDAIIQIGATFLVREQARHGAPVIIYADGNAAYARRGAPFASISSLPAPAIDRVCSRERRVYSTAARLWCMSRALAESFVADFGIPQWKLRTIYAGANVDPSPIDAPDPKVRGAGILFVGKMHERKGSGILLKAFQRVREVVPGAELHFVGCVPQASDIPGVTAHGFLRLDTPAGLQQLKALYARCTVFCLPSRYEPFGVAFLEAMLAGLPCLGVDKWAMPEIIVHGETGWLVPDGDVEQLAQRLIEALTHPDRTAAMGTAGRKRAVELFTWPHVARRAREDLEELLSQGP